MSENAAVGTGVSQDVEAKGVSVEDSKMLTITYVLYALGFLTAITFIAGVIVAYVKRGDAESDVAREHYRWQIRTFWYSTVWSILGIVLSMVVVGYFVLIANACWVIYRIVKGWIRLSGGHGVYS